MVARSSGWGPLAVAVFVPSVRSGLRRWLFRVPSRRAAARLLWRFRRFRRVFLAGARSGLFPRFGSSAWVAAGFLLPAVGSSAWFALRPCRFSVVSCLLC